MQIWSIVLAALLPVALAHGQGPCHKITGVARTGQTETVCQCADHSCWNINQSTNGCNPSGDLLIFPCPKQQA